MIKIDLDIYFPPGHEQAEEAVRTKLRQSILQLIFEQCDAVADQHSFGVRHTDIDVNGSIKVV